MPKISWSVGQRLFNLKVIVWTHDNDSFCQSVDECRFCRNQNSPFSLKIRLACSFQFPYQHFNDICIVCYVIQNRWATQNRKIITREAQYAQSYIVLFGQTMNVLSRFKRSIFPLLKRFLFFSTTFLYIFCRSQ